MKDLFSSAFIKEGYKVRIFGYRFRIILFLFIYPYMVGFSPDSTNSSGTIVDLLIGTGSHSAVTYDCAGNPTSITRYSAVDYGVSASHNIEAFEFGGRAGGYSVKTLGQEHFNNSYYNNDYGPAASNNTPVFYLNPFIGAGNKYFDINVGVSFFSESANSLYDEIYFNKSFVDGNVSDYLIGNGDIHPSWSIRIGNREKFHFSTQYLSSVPLFSGGGIADAGFGFGSQETRNLTWIGTSLGPYQEIGLSIKQNIQVSDAFDILLRGRAGMIENTFEGGISAGLRIIM